MPPLLITQSISIDLTSKESNLGFQKTAEKSFTSNFGDFAKASITTYMWNLTERLLLAPHNVKQVFSEFPGGWLDNIGGWQDCKLIYCSYPHRKSSFFAPPFNDGDAFHINYIEHPLSGMATYLYYRALSFDRASAGVGTFIGILFFEYTIEGFQQPPSLNDIILTPLLSSVFGILAEESSDLLSQRNSQFLRALSYIVNPAKVLTTEGNMTVKSYRGITFGFNL